MKKVTRLTISLLSLIFLLLSTSFTPSFVIVRGSEHSERDKAASAALPGLPHSAPATGSWSIFPTPGTTGFVILSPSEISHLAIGKDGKTFYALDSLSSRLFKSINAGISWMELTADLRPQGILGKLTDLALAPDDPFFLAVVEDGTRVHISTDGGRKFTYTGLIPALPPTLIQDIAISPLYGPSRDVIIVSARLNDGISNGIVARLTLPSPARWENLTDPYQVRGWVEGDVTSVAISPNYATDFTILVIASTPDRSGSNDGDTFINILNTRALPLTWNDPKLFPGYPVKIETPATDSPAEGTAHPGPKAGQGGRILTSAIVLPQDFSGAEAAKRRVYVAWNSLPQISGGAMGNPDAYRIDNITVIRLNANAGADIPLSSLAYFGTVASGILWAGEVKGSPETASVQVRRTTNPQASLPSWQLSAKPPTGSGNVVLQITPDGKAIYAATSSATVIAKDETALSRSLDGGITWNQISLIDTDMDTATAAFQDVAPSPDSKTIYLVTTTPRFDSLWRTTTKGANWERVLCFFSYTNTAILRTLPDDPSGKSFYLVETNTAVTGITPLYFTPDSGQNWQKLTAPLPAVDLAIASPNTLYIVNSAGQVVKSPDGGKTWSKPVDSRVGSARMLATAPGNYVFVGGSGNGTVSYSSDGGANFVPLLSLGGARGTIQVVADIDFATNKTIYAASDTPGEGVYRFVIGTSHEWAQIKRVEGYQRLSGLVQHWGIIYASFYWYLPPPPPPHPAFLPPSSGVIRCLNPSAPTPAFDSLTTGIPKASPPLIETGPPLSPQFNRPPSSLKISDGINLWAIDTTTPFVGGRYLPNALYHYFDPQSPKAPVLPPPLPPAPPAPEPEEIRGVGIALPLTLIALLALIALLTLIALKAINLRKKEKKLNS